MTAASSTRPRMLGVSPTWLLLAAQLGGELLAIHVGMLRPTARQCGWR
jgi:hypothetical protein